MKFLKLLLMATVIGVYSPVVYADGGHSHSKKNQQKQSAMVHAKVNKIKRSERKINVSHGPIKQLGWPAMTMDFRVAKEVKLDLIKEGQELMISIEPGPDGLYIIKKVMMH